MQYADGGKERVIMLGAFTLFHVVLSLIGIGSGVVVLYGLLRSQRLAGWTLVFLGTTVATSATGFLFPVHRFMPSHGLGVVSLIVLAIAIVARYKFRLVGGWRRTYVVTAVMALYLNVFVFIVQLFEKVPGLKAAAPFQAIQVAVLLLFVGLGTRVAMKFKGLS